MERGGLAMTRKNHIMNEIFETDKQDYGEIRRLCLICHGLDRISDELFENPSCDCDSEETKKVFHKLMSGSLKKLAIAIQRNIYHKNLKRKDYPILAGGSSYYVNYRHVSKDFNIKDICDKIINADSVSNDLIPTEDFGDRKITTLFTGEHHGEAWALYLSVECFVEAILNFLDRLEANGSYPKTPRVNLFSQNGVFDDGENYYGAFP
jgi:hypothetical protein